MSNAMKIEIIRDFSDELLEAVRYLVPQLTDTVDEVQEQTIRQTIETQDAHLFVVRSMEDEIVGMLTLIIVTIPTSRKAYIEDVVLDASCQGKGVGRKLLSEAIAFAKEQGVSRIELTSSPWRVAANKLYQGLGFEVRETNFYRLQL